MTIHLCVPWRTDHGQRERVWWACQLRWMRLFPGIVTHEGVDHSQPFNRSAARNNAVDRLTLARPDWDVAVFADADVAIGHAGQVHAAIEAARDSGRMVFAHTWQATLSREATELVLGGTDPTAIPRDEAEWEQHTLSGVYAVPRPLWEALGGFDERYRAWGLEDHSFALAAKVLAGRLGRAQGNVYHLWHERPRQEREGQPHYADNHALFERYNAARHSLTEMRRVLDR